MDLPPKLAGFLDGLTAASECLHNGGGLSGLRIGCIPSQPVLPRNRRDDTVDMCRFFARCFRCKPAAVRFLAQRVRWLIRDEAGTPLVRADGEFRLRRGVRFASLILWWAVAGEVRGLELSWSDDDAEPGAAADPAS